MDEQVSVIIPVYNVEEYLEECLDSVIGQTYSNIEIILVNDGSTDKSYDICRKYARIDSRIMLLSQKNQGVSAARNNGILNSHGKYLTFVDSDDYIEKDYIEQLMKAMDKTIDIVCCSVPTDWIGYGIQIKDKVHMAKLFSEFGYTWGKLIRKNCIDTLFHAQINYAEDYIFYIKLIKNLRALVVLDYQGYHYRIRVNSLSGKAKNQKHTIEEFYNKNSFALYYQENMESIQGYEVKVKRIINSHCYYVFCLLILLMYRLSKEEIYIDKEHYALIHSLMRKNYRDFLGIVVLDEKNWKRFLFGTMLLLFPKTGAKIADVFL